MEPKDIERRESLPPAADKWLVSRNKSGAHSYQKLDKSYKLGTRILYGALGMGSVLLVIVSLFTALFNKTFRNEMKGYWDIALKGKRLHHIKSTEPSFVRGPVDSTLEAISGLPSTEPAPTDSSTRPPLLTHSAEIAATIDRIHEVVSIKKTAPVADRPPTSPIDLLLPFYQGTGKNSDDLSLQNIWDFSPEKKEAEHHFIQWLFPSNLSSVYNPTAPILNERTLSAMKADPLVLRNLKKSFEVMLSFYGLKYDINGKEIIKSENFSNETSVLLKWRDHNHLRITRILKCLVQFGLVEEANAFLKIVKEIAVGHIDPNSIRYWDQAVTRNIS